MYEGHTIFSAFSQNYNVYKKIYDQLSESIFADEDNESKKSIENCAIRRLYRILRMPTMDLLKNKKEACCPTCENVKNPEICEGNCRGFKSILLKSVTYTNEKFRDELIKISMYCEETEISSFANSFDDIQALF